MEQHDDTDTSVVLKMHETVEIIGFVGSQGSRRVHLLKVISRDAAGLLPRLTAKALDTYVDASTLSEMTTVDALAGGGTRTTTADT